MPAHRRSQTRNATLGVMNEDIMIHLVLCLEASDLLAFALTSRSAASAVKRVHNVIRTPEFETLTASISRMRWCVDKVRVPKARVCAHAARSGDVRFFHEALRLGAPWTEEAYAAAARYGRLSMLKAMKRLGGPAIGCDTLVAAAASHSEATLLWVHAQGVSWDSRCWKAAMSSKCIMTVMVLWRHKCPLDDSHVRLCITVADLRMLKDVHQITRETIKPWFIECAIQRNCMAMLGYLLKNVTFEPGFTPDLIITWACEHDAPDVLLWITTQRILRTRCPEKWCKAFLQLLRRPMIPERIYASLRINFESIVDLHRQSGQGYELIMEILHRYRKYISTEGVAKLRMPRMLLEDIHMYVMVMDSCAWTRNARIDADAIDFCIKEIVDEERLGAACNCLALLLYQAPENRTKALRDGLVSKLAQKLEKSPHHAEVYATVLRYFVTETAFCDELATFEKHAQHPAILRLIAYMCCLHKECYVEKLLERTRVLLQENVELWDAIQNANAECREIKRRRFLSTI